MVKNNTEAYNYDPVGNRQTGSDKFDGYTYDNANEMLTSTKHPHQNRQNEYDVNGNLIMTMPKKLLIRGGSIAAGYGVGKSYVDILKSLLLPRRIDVINRSRHRETSFDGIGTFQEDIAILKPDILLFHFGIDDAFQYVYRSEFQENLVQMIRLARIRFNPFICLVTSHTFDNPYDMDAVNIFYRSLRIVATDMSCELIPVHSYWAGYLQEYNLCNDDLVLSDTRYPNEKGHQVMAEAVMNSLNKILKQI